MQMHSHDPVHASSLEGLASLSEAEAVFAKADTTDRSWMVYRRSGDALSITIETGAGAPPKGGFRFTRVGAQEAQGPCPPHRSPPAGDSLGSTLSSSLGGLPRHSGARAQQMRAAKKALPSTTWVGGFR